MRFRRRHATWTLIIAILTVLGYGVRQTGRLGAVPTSHPVIPGTYQVVKDIDGDTIDVMIAGTVETVRFIGVDTPETHDPRKPVQCFGQVAAAYTKSQVEGKSVRLEADPEDSDRDKYHRLLRYVYLPDGRLLNADLIQNGYGFAYVVFPFTKIDDFRALESQAREQNKGLWAGCNIDSSSEIKQTTGKK